MYDASIMGLLFINTIIIVNTMTIQWLGNLANSADPDQTAGEQSDQSLHCLPGGLNFYATKTAHPNTCFHENQNGWLWCRDISGVCIIFDIKDSFSLYLIIQKTLDSYIQITIFDSKISVYKICQYGCYGNLTFIEKSSR